MSIFLALRFESMFSGLTSHLEGKVDYVTNKFYPLATFPESEPWSIAQFNRLIVLAHFY